MRFAMLGSGSRGNSTLVEYGKTRVLLDCGFSVTETVKRLQRLGVEADSLTAIVVTHEHGDHAKGVGTLARKFGLPVYVTHGTYQQVKWGEVPAVHEIDSHYVFDIDDLRCQPFPVPHDAREPVQFVFSSGKHRLGILTDTGSQTLHITNMLDGCDALILECNHDVDMLAEGPYPASLKERVGGRLGHLSNEQAAGILEDIDTGDLQYLVAAHLSDKNNSEGLARDALVAAMGCDGDDVQIACQDNGLGWCEIC